MPVQSFIVTCEACGTGNRVPVDKEGLQGVCGNCRAPLQPLYYRPQQQTDETFDIFVRRYPGPIVAEFWAPW